MNHRFESRVLISDGDLPKIYSENSAIEMDPDADLLLT
jgi:hypothetical protein